MDVRLRRGGHVFRARRDAPGTVSVQGRSGDPVPVAVIRLADGSLAVRAEDGLHRAEAVRDGDTVWVRFRGRTYCFEIDRGRGRARGAAPGGLASPMPGQVQKVLVAAGDRVEADQPLLVVEAMKMQLEIKAPRAGRVKRLLAAEGGRVRAGAPLVELEEDEA